MEFELESLKLFGLDPLENSHAIEHPNCGTVINFLPLPTSSSSIVRIGSWRMQNLDCAVSPAYGVLLSAKEGKILGGNHRKFIRISGRGQTRFYPISLNTRWWDELLMPNQVVYDWDSSNESHRLIQLHFPDLKWFDPGYISGRQVISKEALIAKAQARLERVYKFESV